MRTLRFGSSLPPHSIALVSSSRNAYGDRVSELRVEFRPQVRHHRVDAFGRLASARNHQLDPIRPCGHDFNRSRFGRLQAPRTVSSSVAGATGLWTYMNAWSRTAVSSVSGVSSEVITTTRGPCLAVAQLREQSSPVIRGIQTSSNSRSKGCCHQSLQGLDAIFGDGRRESGIRSKPSNQVSRDPIVVNDKDFAHERLSLSRCRWTAMLPRSGSACTSGGRSFGGRNETGAPKLLCEKAIWSSSACVQRGDLTPVLSSSGRSTPRKTTTLLPANRRNRPLQAHERPGERFAITLVIARLWLAATV